MTDFNANHNANHNANSNPNNVANLKAKKLSRYNHFQPWQGGYHIAYNALSGALAVMTEENYRAYNQIADKINSTNGHSTFDEGEQELLKQLEFGRFAYSAENDELDSIKFTNNLHRYDQTSLGLTIAPTMACNMACHYCYENNTTRKMSPEVIEALLDFIDRRADQLRTVDICWYGGEPLLALDIIEDITESLIELSEEKHFEYVATMISNGYLLTPAVVDRLVELRVKMVQVTLDGPAASHNAKRPLKNGKESFATIIENLKYASTKLAIGVRVNVDKSFSLEMIRQLLGDLKAAGLERRIGIYFGQLEPATQACGNIADACYGNADFSNIESEYFELLLSEGFRIEKLPQPVGVFCMAQRINAFVIDPEGFLYRCYNYVGDQSHAAGNIKDGVVDYQNKNFKKLFQFNALESQRCLNCDILPICLGGCPAQRADRAQTEDDVCLSWKHNLGPMLNIIAASRQQKLQAASKE